MAGISWLASQPSLYNEILHLTKTAEGGSQSNRKKEGLVGHKGIGKGALIGPLDNVTIMEYTIRFNQIELFS